jgi:hypothetical protein
MAREYEGGTSFITPRGPYCYVNMAYGLKTIYPPSSEQHTTLGEHIGKTVEVYVYDIVVKTH